MPSSQVAAKRVDSVQRRAALFAALIAVPVGLGAGAGILLRSGALSQPDTGPVEMAVRALAEADELICRSVIADLPDEVAGNARRQVEGGPEQNAAYGDPPVKLQCGTDQPAVEPTRMVYVLSGVCWVAGEDTRDPVWTTIDRRVPVSVAVPGPPEGSGQVVAGFASAIRENDPVLPSVPSGCT